MKEEEDYLGKLNYLSFAMRLKRISDNMMHDAIKLYKQLDVSIEPNWYIIFLLLKEYNELSVTQISKKIKLAHTSVITIISKMTKAGFITSKQSEIDQRKRLITLSNKGKEMLPTFEKLWTAGEKGIANLFKGNEGLDFLKYIETQYQEKGYKQRTLDELKLVLNQNEK